MIPLSRSKSSLLTGTREAVVEVLKGAFNGDNLALLSCLTCVAYGACKDEGWDSTGDSRVASNSRILHEFACFFCGEGVSAQPGDTVLLLKLGGTLLAVLKKDNLYRNSIFHFLCVPFQLNALPQLFFHHGPVKFAFWG